MLNPDAWHGSAAGKECTLHQIAPYIGKMKSTMAGEIIRTYSAPGDLVLDPFAGSGAIALESMIAGRNVICTDINPYATLLTRAKVSAPPNLETALEVADNVLDYVMENAQNVSLNDIPLWVKSFFHPQTLQEILAFVKKVKDENNEFLMACLLGILHHQRPGFLSFPSSHLVPYLRSKKFPREKFPEMYEYRPLRPRLISKIHRLYKRPFGNYTHNCKCYQADVRDFQLTSGSIDAIVTSPPYMDALDYARDNRLRLWFLGINDLKQYDAKSRSIQNFSSLMRNFLINASDWLRDEGYCVCVVGEIGNKNRSIDIANLIANIATKEICSFKLESIVTDRIPDVRRSRKEGAYVKTESVVALVKRRE